MVYVEEKRSFQMHSLNFWLINLNALVIKDKGILPITRPCFCDELLLSHIHWVFILYDPFGGSVIISRKFDNNINRSVVIFNILSKFSCNDGKLTKLYVSGLSLTFS